MKKTSSAARGHRGKVQRADRHQRFSRQRVLRAFADVCAWRSSSPTSTAWSDPPRPQAGQRAARRVQRGLRPRLGHRAGVRSRSSFLRRRSDPTDPGITFGTAGYMAPEQARGRRDLDGRADVYALGCILFEMPHAPALPPAWRRGARSGRPSHGGGGAAGARTMLCASARRRIARERIASPRRELRRCRAALPRRRSRPTRGLRAARARAPRRGPCRPLPAATTRGTAGASRCARQATRSRSIRTLAAAAGRSSAA